MTISRILEKLRDVRQKRSHVRFNDFSFLCSLIFHRFPCTFLLSCQSDCVVYMQSVCTWMRRMCLWPRFMGYNQCGANNWQKHLILEPKYTHWLVHSTAYSMLNTIHDVLKIYTRKTAKMKIIIWMLRFYLSEIYYTLHLKVGEYCFLANPHRRCVTCNCKKLLLSNSSFECGMRRNVLYSHSWLPFSSH